MTRNTDVFFLRGVVSEAEAGSGAGKRAADTKV